MRKSIALKIFSIALLLLVLMAAVTGISSLYLDRVTDESRILADYYLPIGQKVNWAARHSSAELLHFERFVNLRIKGAPASALKAERKAMQERGAMAQRAIVDALDLVRKAQADKSVSVDATTLAVLGTGLPQIATAHASMQEAMRRVLSDGLIAEGPTRAGNVLAELMDKQRAAVVREISHVIASIEQFSNESARRALALEQKAEMLSWSITALAILLGLIVAAYITRELVRPLRELLLGTRAVEQGNFDVRIDVRTSDELESLAGSFNSMIVSLKQKEAIQATFGKYVDPRIVKNLVEDRNFASVGERRPMSVLFADLEGFTGLCEQITPDAALKFLNAYFNKVSEPIIAKHGIIDKYIGDAVMAFWGPPFTEPEDHARLACEAALEQLAGLTGFRKTIPDIIGLRKGLPGVNMRAGISTGEVIVGNVGSERLKGYTVIGDTVNLASRLETACKQYGVNIILSEETRAQARDAIEVRELDRIRVVGKTDAVSVFELLGVAGGITARTGEMRDAFAAALARYRAGDIAAARALWQECARIAPEDPPTRVFLARCDELAARPLPADWNGVWTLSVK